MTLNIDQLQPIVDSASLFAFEEETWHKYRVIAYHFILVEAGELEVTAKKIKAKKGDMLCFPPTKTNRYGNRKACRFYQMSLRFQPEIEGHPAVVLDELGDIPMLVHTRKEHARIREAFELVCRDIDKPDAGNRLKIKARVFDILASCCPNTTSSKQSLDPWIRMKVVLESNLDQQIHIATCAKEMKMSTNHFIREYKKRFGLSPLKYRNQIKIQKSLDLLEAEPLSIKEVAARLGYEDTKAFSRGFQKHFGCTPSHWRELDEERLNQLKLQHPPVIPMNKILTASHVNEQWVINQAKLGSV